jgi:nucleoside-diphosphate-sugar epimerase
MSTVFLAGATGAIGSVLCRLLVADGWRVVGTTRSAAKAAELKRLGVEPVVVDAFDRDALVAAVKSAAPDVVVHQLTDLPKENTPEAMAEGRARNAKLREIGTDNLAAAATAAGAKRFVAQSIAFAYAPGPKPYAEEAPLDPAAKAVATLERLTLGGPFEGLVLRYGHLYGPNTWTPVAAAKGSVHVDAAADAARRALTRGAPGIYNVAEDDGTVSTVKARTLLDWSAAFRAGP